MADTELCKKQYSYKIITLPIDLSPREYRFLIGSINKKFYGILTLRYRREFIIFSTKKLNERRLTLIKNYARNIASLLIN